ncbi:MAG: hypothetical protein E7Z89_04800 [Cyanobacteria bacterium SIG28]|nr:hypothetical protein [Cyanobacteria bacterium SIG28]
MNNNKKLLFIQILAFVGILLSVELAIIYYNANYNKYALSSFCSVSDFIDCDGVAKTKTSQFLGIPLAYWGIFFYSTVLFLTFVEKLKKIKFLKFLEVFKNPLAYIFVLGLIAFACSMTLAGISLYGIKKLCILCFITYFIDLIIALVALGDFKNFIPHIKSTVLDFIDGVKTYTKTFIVLLLLFSGFLTYSGMTLNFVPHIKKRKEFIMYRSMKVNPYRVKGNILGNENGKVIVELYSDYVCPLCYINNIMIHKAAKEFSNILVIHKNYPFDKECNKYISASMHPRACYMSKAALAAAKQNNYWEMSSLLYERQPKKEKHLVKLIEELNFDQEKFFADMESEEVKQELNAQMKAAYDLDIDATPTMIINGDKIVGIKPYDELKKILKDHGAKR